jgi:uncharacterized protein YqhQ
VTDDLTLASDAAPVPLQDAAVAPDPAPALSDEEIERRFAAPVTHTHIGGQALIEGVMMRGRKNWAVAVRTADGSIHVEDHDLAPNAATGWRAVPVLRGVYALYETLALSLRAFGVAASLSGASEEEQLTSNEITWTIVLGVALAVVVFIVAPALLTNVVAGSSAKANPLWWNVVDGVLRLGVFFLYIWGIGRIPDIRRVFAYHGAEHKSIHAFEHGVPLEPRYVQRYDTLHIRCGTAFLLMVMVISIVVFSLIPGKPILAAWGITNGVAVSAFNIVVRILLLPVVAGLAYEVTVKWAGNHSENAFVKVLLWPGMQLQRLTTREPDDGMVEVAAAALRAVADREASDEAGPVAAAAREEGPPHA